MKSELFLAGTPARFLSVSQDALRHALVETDIACLRLDPTPRCDLTAAARHVIETVEGTEIPVLLRGHPERVIELGLSGTQLGLSDIAIREARQLLGQEHLIGFGPVSRRHTGMVAAEAGADYVSIGPFGNRQAEAASLDFVHWWSELVELPCLVEGDILPKSMERFLGIADFVEVPEEVWSNPDNLCGTIAQWLSLAKESQVRPD